MLARKMCQKPMFASLRYFLSETSRLTRNIHEYQCAKDTFNKKRSHLFRRMIRKNNST